MTIKWSSGFDRINELDRGYSYWQIFCFLPFTKSFRKILKWNTTVWVVPAENLQEQWNIWKVVLFFRRECCKRKFVFHFFDSKLSLIPVSAFLGGCQATFPEKKAARETRQTSDSSWKFLQIESVRLKTVQTNCYGQNQRETTNFREEKMKSKVQVKRKLGHVVQISVLKPDFKGAFLWDHPDQDQWSEITRITVDQMNRRIHSGQGFIGSFDLPWSKWSRIADPDPNHPKATQPYKSLWCLILGREGSRRRVY